MRSPGLFACALIAVVGCGGGGDDVQQPIDAASDGDVAPDAATIDAAVVDARLIDGPITPDARLGDGGMCTLGVEVQAILNGTGTVTSTPAGIACAPDCREEVACGSTFQLIPLPGPNSVFTGWGVGCTGTGTCTITVNQAFTVVVAGFRGSP